MKKLLIAAAAVCTAVATQAAAMDWAVTTDAAGETVYICTVGSGFKSAADITAAMFGTSGNAGATVASGRAPNFTYMAQGTASGIDASEVGMQDFYAVVIDSSGEGYYSMMGSGEVYTTATKPVKGEVDMKALIASGNYTKWEGTPTPPTPPIPEPTSGLLLLLGVAGMALRRRRA